ncbi:MAG: hypothetical protein HC773_27750 [Scytonema sp. CRU_2_7]|nr:hypothetical protein [Scytonema sp. CRU_2_7]
MSHTILRSSFFDADKNGHGGNRRTAQLEELVTSAGYGISDIGRDEIRDQLGTYLAVFIL